MHVEVLTTGWERARGAMFRSTLEQSILVFCYPQPVRHLYHTFFCPPLRITALSDDGKIAFSESFTSGTFVRLPPARIVLESAPDVSPEEVVDIVAAQRPEVLTNPIHGDASGFADESIAKLFCLALIEPMQHLRSFGEHLERSDGDDEEVLKQFPLWKQGQILESAFLVVENSDVPGSTVPPNSLELARRICERELDGREPEMIAAGLAGGEWPEELKSPLCLRCHTPCTWRQVIRPHDETKRRAVERAQFGRVPSEIQWRYERPENHVPLCRNCIRLEAWKDPQQRQFVGLGVWGKRFDAFLQWHEAAIAGDLPASWDRIEYPLWPERFGGDSWEAGSGAWQHAGEMRSPTGVQRLQIHAMLLGETLDVSVDDIARAMGEEPPEPARPSPVSAAELTELIMAS